MDLQLYLKLQNSDTESCFGIYHPIHSLYHFSTFLTSKLKN